jgi:sensor histidine kinase regulating citrate/malate metabolism
MKQIRETRNTHDIKFSKRRSTVIITVMIGVVALFFVLILAIFVQRKAKKEAGDLSQVAVETAAETASDPSETEALAEGQILYGGELYQYNTHLSNYLFL